MSTSSLKGVSICVLNLDVEPERFVSQRELARCVGVPFISSSLLLVPLAFHTLAPDKRGHKRGSPEASERGISGR